MKVDTPICIVGAGMSGILAAEKLRSLGYRNIDLIEARSEIGGYAESIEIEGKAYDFQAHLIAQQHFGKDLSGTPLQELLDKYPMETHDEALYFVSKSPSGEVQMGMPPNFLPLLLSMTPDQLFGQVNQVWTLLERAVKNRTKPGLQGLAFERLPGETWESFRARHPPLVGQILQSILIYANMRRLHQPVEAVIGANGYISGNVCKLVKALLAAFPQHKERMLAKMPESLVAQLSSERPICKSFPKGFKAFLSKIVHDNALEVLLNTQVQGIQVLKPGTLQVNLLSKKGEQVTSFHKTYARVIITSRPRQTRKMVMDEDVRALFSEENCPTTWTRTYVIKPEEELLPFPSSKAGQESLGFWLIDPYANYTDTDVEQSLHCITGLNKQHETPYWLGFSNSNSTISDDEAWAIAKQSLFLFKNPLRIAERLSNWPVYPAASAIRKGWYSKLDEVQGRNGIHFLGEVISGPTIEPISAIMSEVIPSWFGRAEPASYTR